MTRLALALLLIPLAAQAADVCKPPNVARVVISPAGYETAPLHCPARGVCWHEHPEPWERAATIRVVCMSPQEHEKALER